MTAKIKILFAGLGLTALILVIVISNSFRTHLKAVAGPLIRSSASFNFDPSANLDSDNDGLTDDEEAYWNTNPQNPDTDGDGFKDGEEVASGHDPLIPGPNDLLVSDDNITQKFAEMAVAGFAEGSLKSDNPNYQQSLSNMTDAIVSQIHFTPPKTFNITTVKSTTDSQEKYLATLSPVFQEFLTTFYTELAQMENKLNAIGSQGFAGSNTSDYFQSQAKAYKKLSDQAEKISIPLNWKDTHLNFLQTIYLLYGINDAISRGDQDPIKAMAAFDSFGNITDQMDSVINPFFQIAKEQKLNGNSFIEQMSK